MSGVKRYRHSPAQYARMFIDTLPSGEYVTGADYDRLEQECERLRHSAANDLLDRLATELLDSGAENYQESVFDLNLGSELLTASVILRYRDKPSAHELRMSAEAERDELRAQCEAMRKEAEAMQDLLRKVAPHFAAPPGLGYLYQWIDAALQANK